MPSIGPQPPASWMLAVRLLRRPWVLSTLVHAAGLGVAAWVTLSSAAPASVERIGRLDLRPTREEAIALPETEVDVPPEPVLTLEEPAPLDPEASDESAFVLPPEAESPHPEPRPDASLEVPLAAVRPRKRPPTPSVPASLPLLPPRMQPSRPPPPVVHVQPTRLPAPPPAPRRAAPPPPAPAPLRVLWAPDPRQYYPDRALRRRLGGHAVVRLSVDPSGRVVAAVVERSSGFSTLDEAAVRLAYAYRFSAGTTTRMTRLPVTFRPPSGGGGF